MIAARGRDHARSRDIPHQQVGKRAPGFERTGMLHQLELEDDADAVQPKIRAFDFNYRGPSYMGMDRFVSAGDVVAVDEVVGADGNVAEHDAIIIRVEPFSGDADKGRERSCIGTRSSCGKTGSKLPGTPTCFQSHSRPGNGRFITIVQNCLT